MTTPSPILGLTLYNSTTDQAELFSSFRAVTAGVSSSSNFYKLDTAYGVQASQITALQNKAGSVYVPCTFVSANYYESNSIAEITSLINNMTIIIRLDTTSAGTVTLNINALGTKSLMKVNSSGAIVNIAGGELKIGKNYLFRYDGTQWIWVNSQSADQIYISGTTGNVLTVGSDNTILGTTTPSLLISDTIHAGASKTTPVDADEIGIWNSVGSVLGKLTWSNLKATLKTYFDTLYGDMILSSVQTITGAKTFGTIGGAVSKLILAGSTSGSTILNASAVAGSTTVVLPSASDTLIGKATTDILTNKSITPRIAAVTLSATPSITVATTDIANIHALNTAITSITTNFNYTTPTVAVDGQKIIIRIYDNGTPRAITWGAAFRSCGATLPTTTVANKWVYVGLIYNLLLDVWDCIAVSQEA